MGGLTQNFGISLKRLKQSISLVLRTSSFERNSNKRGQWKQKLGAAKETNLSNVQVGFGSSFAEQLVIFQLMAGLCFDMFCKILSAFPYTSPKVVEDAMAAMDEAQEDHLQRDRSTTFILTHRGCPCGIIASISCSFLVPCHSHHIWNC